MEINTAAVFIATVSSLFGLLVLYFLAPIFRWWLERALIWVSQFFPDDEEDPVDYRAKAKHLAQLGYIGLLLLGCAIALRVIWRAAQL